MKLNRRKSLMAIIGGIAGAPQAAKAMANNLKVPPSAGMSGYALKQQYDYGEVNSTKTNEQSQQDYIKSRIETLQKTVNGEFEEHYQEQLERGDYTDEVYCAEIEGFKSVSEVNKRILINKARTNAQKKRWIRDAKRELDKILKQISFLGIKL